LILSQLILAITMANTSGAKHLGPEIYVRTDRSVSVERLAAAVQPMGKIESREKGSRFYLVQLKAGIEAEWAKQRLEKIPGVKALEAQEEPFDLQSMRSVDRKIAHLKSEAIEADKGDEGDKAGVDSDAGEVIAKFTRSFC
jgi:hypothetical protein